MKNFSQLPLRMGVGIVLLNQKNRVFVGKRIDNPENFWQMPQGGIDENESFFEAAKRELEEETGIRSVKLITTVDEWLEYDLPKNLLGKIWNGRYRGQKQKWYIVKFNGKDNEINVNTKRPEFLEWRWTCLENITNTVVDFKLDMYKKIQVEVKKIISN